jgi:uncharacterized protein
MKLLIVLLVVLAGVWLWKRGRRHPPDQAAPSRAGQQALPMVRCAQCGTHVPGNEAVLGQRGSYCTHAHLRESESA